MVKAHISQLAVVETDTFKAENTRRFFSYWQKQRGERPRPLITDLDWIDIADIAASLCIRDVIEDNSDLLCRFWGTKFAESYRVECTGKLISETYTPAGAKNTLRLHEKALSAPMPLRLIGTLAYAEKSEFITFEGIMACVDGKQKPKQHIYAVGQFDYNLDEEDRELLEDEQYQFLSV